MVDGKLVIKAELETQSLKSGIATLDSSINRLGDKFDSINSDMVRTEKSAKGISKSFIGISAAGVGIIAFAKNTPAVAGSMAQMDIAMMELSFTVGESLAPAFEVAADGLSNFSYFIGENQPLVDALGDSIAFTLTNAINGLNSSWEQLESLGIPTAIKWVIDALKEGGSLDFLGGSISEFYKNIGGPGSAAKGFVEELTSPFGEDVSESLGRGARSFFGGVPGTFLNIIDSINKFRSREVTSKDMSMGGSDSTVIYI